MDFTQVESKYKELKRKYDSGAITEDEFKAQLEELMIEDEEGKWWMIGYETGQWYYHDGKKWAQSEPPQLAEWRREQVEALCQEGATALSSGNWEAAIERFEAALALEPSHPEATTRLAEAKARAEEAQRLEARREPEAPPRRSWVWAVVLVIGLILVVILIQSGILSGPGPSPGVGFWADDDVIMPGECTVLHWNVEGVEGVYFLIETKWAIIRESTPEGTLTVCPVETETYKLKNLDGDVIATVDVHVREVKLEATVIGQTAVDLDGEHEHVRTMETNLGNLICDAMLWRTASDNTVIAIHNGGGIRASIPVGDVTMGQVLEVLPFGNIIINFDLTGAEIVEALENGVSKVEEVSGRFPQVGGMRYDFNPSLPAGSRIVMVEVGSPEAGYTPIDMNATYRVATNNFLYGGGDDYEVFKTKAKNATETVLLLSDTLADYIKALSPVSPALEERIRSPS